MTTGTTQDITMTPDGTRPMGVRDYLDSVYGMLRSPSKFYAGAAVETGWKRAASFLTISAIFNATVTGSMFGGSILKMGGAVLVNNLFMPALAAVFTFMLVGLASARQATFRQVFNIHAYASGLLLTASWIPGLGMALEPVRALIVAVGLMRFFNLKWWQAALIVVVTALMLLMFFWSLGPVLVSLVGRS